jgi:hypothetical protein
VLEHQRPKHGDADRDEIRDRVVRLRHGVYSVGKATCATESGSSASLEPKRL